MSTPLANLTRYFIFPSTIVAGLFLAFVLQELFFPEAYQWGLFPGKSEGLKGILFMPAIHGSWAHLLGNLSSLLVLLAAVRYFFPRVFFTVTIVSWILPGVITWFIAEAGYHIGASGMVYSLAFFTFFSGIIRINKYLLSLSLLIGFLYGGLFWGLFPIEEGISWEGHVGGAITGFLLALVFSRIPLPNRLVEEDPFEGEVDSEIIGDAWKLDENGNPLPPKPVGDASSDGLNLATKGQPRVVQYILRPSTPPNQDSKPSDKKH